MDALISIYHFFRKGQLAPIHSGSNDDSIGFINIFSRFDDFRCCLEAHLFNNIEFINHSSGVFGLRLDGLNQIPARDFHEARIIFDARRIRDLAAYNSVFQDQHRQVHPSGIKRCRSR